MVKDLGYCLRAIASFPKMLVKYKLIKFFLISGFISVIIGFLIFYGSWTLGDNLGSVLAEYYPFEQGKKLITNISGWGGRLSLMAFGLVIYKYLVLILTSPVFSPLSQSIEEKYLGISERKPFELVTFGKDMIRGLSISLSNIYKELLFTLILLIIGFVIPGAIILTTPLIFFVQAYYAGFGSMDYFMERRYKIREAKYYVRKHFMIAVVTGSVFLGLLSIPVIGFLLAPGIAAILATKSILLASDY